MPKPAPQTRRESLSVIIPAYNEAQAIVPVMQELDKVLQALPLKCRIIVVDDGSRDATAQNAADAQCETPVRVIRFSRNFGKEAAISAGLSSVETDAAVIIDADGQHPPDMIPQFVKHWQEGYDVVYAKRAARDTDSWLRRNLSRLYYKIVSRENSFIESNAGDFRLMSRPVIDALNSLPEKTRFMKGLFNWVGFKKFPIEYTPRERIADESKYTSLVLLFRFGILGIMSFTTLPLRLISLLGVIVAGLSILYGSYIALRTLIFGVDVPGWATVVAGMMLLGGIQLISIGILGEYVGQIFTEVKNRPLYIVAEVVENDGQERQQAA
ncbi:MAG: glycosyltransferase [Alphaproteobacteria bacterium]|nr:glycosyltransferase [Alphaproteobacteria bacterium]